MVRDGVVIESRPDWPRSGYDGAGPEWCCGGGPLIAGEDGAVRAMVNDHGEQWRSRSVNASGSTGSAGTPDAGDPLPVAPDERKSASWPTSVRTRARLARRRIKRRRSRTCSPRCRKGENGHGAEDRCARFAQRSRCDQRHHTSEVKALIIGSGVGGISESDAMLALTSRATIFGFNVQMIRRRRRSSSARTSTSATTAPSTNCRRHQAGTVGHGPRNREETSARRSQRRVLAAVAGPVYGGRRHDLQEQEGPRVARQRRDPRGRTHSPRFMDDVNEVVDPNAGSACATTTSKSAMIEVFDKGTRGA